MCRELSSSHIRSIDQRGVGIWPDVRPDGQNENTPSLPGRDWGMTHGVEALLSTARFHSAIATHPTEYSSCCPSKGPGLRKPCSLWALVLSSDDCSFSRKIAVYIIVHIICMEYPLCILPRHILPLPTRAPFRSLLSSCIGGRNSRKLEKITCHGSLAIRLPRIRPSKCLPTFTAAMVLSEFDINDFSRL